MATSVMAWPPGPRAGREASGTRWLDGRPALRGDATAGSNQRAHDFCTRNRATLSHARRLRGTREPPSSPTLQRAETRSAWRLRARLGRNQAARALLAAPPRARVAVKPLVRPPPLSTRHTAARIRCPLTTAPLTARGHRQIVATVEAHAVRTPCGGRGALSRCLVGGQGGGGVAHAPRRASRG